MNAIRSSVVAVALTISAQIVLLGVFSTPSTAQSIQFTDTTETSLRGRNSESWGQSIGDLNNDGWPDIFVNNHRDRHSFYFNNGDRTFTEQTLTVDRDSFIGGSYRTIDYHSGAFADIDDDGDTDLFVQWHGVRARSGSWCFFDCDDQTNSSLWLNEGDGRLVDHGEAWQMRPPGGSISGMLIDYDRDGDLDAVQGTLANFILIPRIGPSQFGPTERVGTCARLYSVILSDLSGDGVADFICLREGGFPDGVYAMTSFGLVNIEDEVSIPPINAVVDGIAADFDNDLDPDLFLLRGLSVANDALQPTPKSIEAFLDSSVNTGNSQMRFTTTGVIDIKLSVYNKKPPKIWLGNSQLEQDIVIDRVFQLDPTDTRLHGFPAERNEDVNLYGGYDPATKQWRFMVYPGTRRYEPGYFIVNSTHPIEDLEVEGLSMSDGALLPRLYRNDVNGFLDATWQSGMREPIRCVSVVGADFDNDMDIDLYAVCKRGAANIANRLFMNEGDGTFTEVAGAGGAAGPIGVAVATKSGWGDSVTTADFDNDGFIDLFVSNGLTTFPVRPDAGPHKVYFGEPNDNNWIELELRGTSSVANAQGARIVATSGAVSQLREQGSGYHRFSQNHDRIHFGLGKNNTTDLTITWPDGNTETFSNVAANQIYQVTEGSGIAVKNIGPAATFADPVAGDECGYPYFEGKLDHALLVWKDCVTGTWSIRTSAGGQQQWLPKGQLTGTNPSGGDILDVTRHSLEATDTLLTQDNIVSFSFGTSNIDIDGFEFNLSGDSSIRSGSSSDWKVANSFSDGWRSKTFDDSSWQSATVIGDYGASPWGTRVSGIPADTQGAWIWTSDVANDSSVYLRYRIPDGVAANSTITVSADNRHTTFLNGTALGTGNQWTVAASYTATVSAGDVVAIEAANLGGPAGVIADIRPTNPGASGEVCLDASLGNDALVLLGNRHVPVKTPIALPSLMPCTPSSPPKLSLQDLELNEADGSAAATVTLSSASSEDVSVRIHTRSGSARGGEDFYGFTRAITIAAGNTSATTAINLVNDSKREPIEQFQLRLFDAVNGVIEDADATVTIIDDDTNTNTPKLSIADAVVNESDTNIDVQVSLSAPSAQPINFTIHTRSGTAQGGSDFYGFTRSLTIPTGQVSTTTTVTLINDNAAEPNENFLLRLVQPTNAVIDVGTATITVADDD